MPVNIHNMNYEQYLQTEAAPRYYSYLSTHVPINMGRQNSISTLTTNFVEEPSRQRAHMNKLTERSHNAQL